MIKLARNLLWDINRNSLRAHSPKPGSPQTARCLCCNVCDLNNPILSALVFNRPDLGHVSCTDQRSNQHTGQRCLGKVVKHSDSTRVMVI